MPSQRGGKPRNEVVAEVFQQITVSGRALTAVRCRHCQYVLAMGAIACGSVARLNPSNDEVLKHFLNSSVDGHVLIEQPI